MNNKLYEDYWLKIFFFEKFFQKILHENRVKINKIIFDNINFNNLSFIDIGTTPDIGDHHNTILKYLKSKNQISIFSNLDCTSISKKYKNIKNVYIGDARNIRIEDKFDIVHSSATIEHVGSYDNQKKFINECYKLSNKYVVITTPNRNYPVDFHTKIPFMHLLPKKIHRHILKFIGLKFFSLEENLNLINKQDIQKMCQDLKIANYKLYFHKFLFFKSNIILIIKK